MHPEKAAHRDPPDPSPDWDRKHEKKVKVYRLILLGHLWSILASILGFFILLWLLLRA